MSGISKSDLNHVLQAAAKTIGEAKGKDQKTTRAELQKALENKHLPRKQRALVNLFFKFSDFSHDGKVTVRELDRAVEFAKAHLVAKYELDHTDFTRGEQQQMHLVGKRVHDLAKALKAAAAEVD